MLLLFKKLFAEGDSRGDKFCHSSLDYLLGQFRILQLVAHGHLVPGTDKPWKIYVKRMVRKTGKRHRRSRTVRPFGEHYPEHLACNEGVIGKCLIKVPDPEKEHCLRMFCLDLEILFHQRGFRYLFLLHIDK